MIVDSGAPMSMATIKWMDRYLKCIKVKENEIIEKGCNRKFKMGENVYLSNREIALPVTMKTDRDDYIRKMITVSIVDRKNELMLCGLKTLIEWKAAVFYEKSEIMFGETKKSMYENLRGWSSIGKIRDFGRD